MKWKVINQSASVKNSGLLVFPAQSEQNATKNIKGKKSKIKRRNKMTQDHQPRMVKPESPKKPKCKLVGQDGNIFNLIGIAARALKDDGQHKAAKEMTNKILFTAKSYGDALNAIQEYVDVS